jgi:Putative transmembrane protein (PGPGW)
MDAPELTSTDTTTTTDSSSSSTQHSTQPSLQDVMRKTGVAVAGGTMVVVGLIMIPLPTPFGCVVAGSGMAVLGTEFPVAERILDETCNKVADAIEYSSRDDPEDDLDLSKCSNEKMREILKERKAKRDPMKHNLKQIGKKVAPVIRKIGEGIDKEQLERTAETISKAANDAKHVFKTKSSEIWELFRESKQWDYSKIPTDIS